MLRSAGTPPAFPRDLILPGPQHAINAPPFPSEPASPADDPQATPAAALGPARPGDAQSARRAKGKKARKAALRLAAAEQARKAASPKAQPPILASAEASPQPAALPAILPAALPLAPIPSPAPQPAGEATQPVPCVVAALENCGGISAAPAPMPVAARLPELEPELEPELAPEPAPQSAPAFLLPSAPEPLVTAPPPLAADVPLPRSRSLVPARRQGLVDMIAFLLRDSGRRLARWSARRHKMREQYAQLYASDLRKAAMQSQLEALEALRQQQR